MILVGATVCAGYLLPTTSNAELVNKDATASFELIAPLETLKITNASELIFDDATISEGDVVTITTDASSISIQELSGNAPGWRLSAELGQFTSTGSKVINGAQLFYPTVVPTTTTLGDVSNILPQSEATDTAFTGENKGEIIDSEAGAKTIVTASEGKGYGSWTMTYDEANKIQLKIPTGHLAGNYIADLTYTLTDGPTA